MRLKLGEWHRRQRCEPGKAHGEGAPPERSHARACDPRVRGAITRLVVEVGNWAGAWRSAAAETELAFGWWKQAPRGERDAAAAIHLAATEREETAANEYRRAWETCCRTVP